MTILTIVGALIVLAALSPFAIYFVARHEHARAVPFSELSVRWRQVRAAALWIVFAIVFTTAFYGFVEGRSWMVAAALLFLVVSELEARDNARVRTRANDWGLA